MVPKKVNPELMLLRELIDEWLADVVHLTLAESSHERYSQLARDHVNPHIGGRAGQGVVPEAPPRPDDAAAQEEGAQEETESANRRPRYDRDIRSM